MPLVTGVRVAYSSGTDFPAVEVIPTAGFDNFSNGEAEDIQDFFRTLLNAKFSTTFSDNGLNNYTNENLAD
jgi:hypothetical protein